MVKEFFVPMSAKYKQYWGDTLAPGYHHYSLFGLLVAKTVRVEKGGMWIVFEPSEYFTEEVYNLHKELFKGFFDAEDVPEIIAKMKKLAPSAGPSGLPSPPAKEEKRRGRPPKVKEVAATVAASPASSDELEMPKLEL
jgi:hypothetical protein